MENRGVFEKTLSDFERA
jgi:hypothetical protein